jgi:hypothetical protein
MEVNMSHVRRAFAAAVVPAIALFALLAVVFGALSLEFGAPARAADPLVTSAVGYLDSQQKANGGWDDDPASQFLTEDVVLAIAEAAQTGPTWSTAEASTAVLATDTGGQDPSAFLTAVGAAATTPGRAAKFLVLVAAPLGMNTSTLAATVGDPMPNGAFDTDSFFNNTLYAALAKYLVDGTVPASTVTYVLSKQGIDGGWSDGFPGDPEDPDTTSLASQVLVAAGMGPADAPVHDALAFIGSQQNADGTWSAFGDESAESTSRAALGIAAAGFDPNTRCWRDTVAPAGATSQFVGTDAALASLAHPDGSIAGPNAFLPAYGTAQAVQGLQRGWLPVARATAPSCTVVAPEVVEIPAQPVALVPAFTG